MDYLLGYSQIKLTSGSNGSNITRALIVKEAKVKELDGGMFAVLVAHAKMYPKNKPLQQREKEGGANCKN